MTELDSLRSGVDCEPSDQRTATSGTDLPPVRKVAHRRLVPIRSLGENHRGRIAAHLLSLDERDRYLRFGYSAQDDQIVRYVDSLNFERDEIFGIYNRKVELVAVAHLAMPTQDDHSLCAEFGVSVSARSRGRGLGARLFDRAALSATNAGIELMFIHALSENNVMLHIAKKAGSRVERDGTDSEAYLKLPTDSFDTHLAEMIGEQVARFDYKIKVQAKHFWGFLESLQEIRRASVDEQRIEGS